VCLYLETAPNCAIFYLNHVSRREHVSSCDIKYMLLKLISMYMETIAISPYGFLHTLNDIP